MIRFGSVCSGIEAASVAWHPVGWRAAWLSEIELFPCAVLAHHYPAVPNHGDMTALPSRIASGEAEAPEVFCGGTPCQAFSVAGLRRSLSDDRGNLSLTFCEIANAIDSARSVRGEPPAIVFWENVPGVLSAKDNAFGCFLAGLAGEDEPLQPAGGRWTDAGCVLGPKRAVAWRILDAQYFGLAQRRRRVFVVASAREGFDPTAVLFEFEGVRRDTAPSREAGQRIAPTIAGCANGGGANGPGRDVDTVESSQVISMAHGQGNAEIGIDRGPTLTCNHKAPIVAHALRAEPGMKQSTYVAFAHQAGGTQTTLGYDPEAGTVQTLGANQTPAVAIDTYNQSVNPHTSQTIKAPQGAFQESVGAVFSAMQVRRLTPVECERLQGFPDDYTAIPWRGKAANQCPDGPRYKALGNSWAVPVVRWIGQRINLHLEKQ